MRRFIVVATLGLLLAGQVGGCQAADNSVSSDEKADNAKPLALGAKALLIGCSEYKAFGKPLKGPSNDVALMKKLLVSSPYNFKGENVVSLTDQTTPPTRANIEREFKLLAESAQVDDQIVIFFAGHGSRIPDDDPSNQNDPEPDGFDEVLLPTDAGPRDATSKTFPNAIRDDELKRWLDDILVNGARVWAIFDACHSGTVIRGDDDDETDRRIPMEELGVTDEEIEAIFERTRGGPVFEPAPLVASDETANLVALYAALPSETCPEMLPPELMPNEDMDKRYGLLTYTLNKILSTAATPLSYRQLARRIRAQYVAWGRNFPTPVAEGPLLDRRVLGVEQLPERSAIQLVHAKDGLGINQGALFGVTADSVYAVYPPAGTANSKEVVGHVKVVGKKLDLFSAKVQPVEFNAVAVNRQLPIDGRCEPARIEFSNSRMRVAVDPKFANAAGDVVAEARLLERLRLLTGKPRSLVELTDDAQGADWLLRVDGDDVQIVAADRLLTDRLLSRRPLPQRIAEEPARFVRLGGSGPETRVHDKLNGIARVQHLFEVAVAPSQYTKVSVEAMMLRYESPADLTGRVTTDFRFEEGDIIGFEIANRSRVDAYITVLFVDSGYGVSCLFPEGPWMDNLVGHGKTVRTKRSLVNTETTGLEHIVVIGVEARGEPIDFSYLEQATIAVRGESDRGDGGMDSPLGQLLPYLHYPVRRRGNTPLEMSNYGFDTFSWWVEEGKSQE